jgi:hypothetical protein
MFGPTSFKSTTLNLFEPPPAPSLGAVEPLSGETRAPRLPDGNWSIASGALCWVCHEDFAQPWLSGYLLRERTIFNNKGMLNTTIYYNSCIFLHRHPKNSDVVER